MFSKGESRSDARIADSAGLSWEADVISNMRQALRLRGFLIAGLIALAIAESVAIAVMVPLHKVVPYVYAVDRLTGEVRRVDTGNELVTSGSLNEKNWVKQFVIARERYSFRLLQHDYDQVKRLAGPQVWTTYDKLFDGEGALDKRNGEHIEVIPEVLSITLGEGGQATVRYELRTRDYRTTTEPKVTRHVATLRYKFEPRVGITEKEAIENPLGFVVLGYQTDPELVEGGKR